MNKFKKLGLTALAGSLVATSAYAGEVTVAGGASMGVKNNSGTDGGKSWTMGNQLTFTGGGELDNGLNVSISFVLDQGDNETNEEAGASEAFAPDEETEIRNKIGIGSAAAIDFVGRPETTDLGLTLVKKGGMVIVVGLYGGSLKLSLPLVPMRSMTLRGSYVGELRELKELVNIIKSGKIKLISVKKQGLETANQAMSDLRSGKVNGRIVLIPN